MNSYSIKDNLKEGAYWCLFFVFMAIAFLLVGCASCRECKADEVRPSPQVPGKTWQAVPGQVTAPPVIPRHDFATPPTDGPDPATPTPATPPTTPPTPAPTTPDPSPPAPSPSVPSKARTTSTSETEGTGVIINQNSGTVVLNSPGVAPVAPAPGLASPQQPVQAFPVLPIIATVASDPQVQSLTAAALKRAGGSLYYLATGKCPSKPATASASMVMAVPTQGVQMVPVSFQTVQTVPAQTQTVQYAPVQAVQMPLASPQLYTSPAPQFAVVQDPAPAKKCWLFGK